MTKVITELITTIEKQSPAAEAESAPAKSPQIEVLGRGIVVDLELVPFSSLLTHSGGAQFKGKGVKYFSFFIMSGHQFHYLYHSVKYKHDFQQTKSRLSFRLCPHHKRTVL